MTRVSDLGTQARIFGSYASLYEAWSVVSENVLPSFADS